MAYPNQPPRLAWWKLPFLLFVPAWYRQAQAHAYHQRRVALLRAWDAARRDV